MLPFFGLFLYRRVFTSIPITPTTLVVPFTRCCYLRRGEELPEPENRTRFRRAAEGANGDVEDRRNPNVGGIRAFHSAVLEAGTTVERAGATRASL